MLKKYQRDTLEVLTDYLHRCAVEKDPATVYAEITKEITGSRGTYNDAGFNHIPYVCLRLPTGGGKTILAAHSIPIACRELLARDFSLVVWLVPSNAILDQTFNCLQDTTHPYRRVLEEFFSGNVEILKVEDARSLSKGTLQSNTVVIISTFASWRTTSTEGRKVYENNGTLVHHFDNISREAKSELEHFENEAGGTLKHSLANVVYINNPIFIVDEAHNARTELTFKVLERLNPACVIEFTATPKTTGADRSNVLYSVSASRLKDENMIKMPIELLTNKEWQIVVSDAVKKQRELELAAKDEETKTGEYIRPIVLFQAQHDSEKISTINVQEVKNFLLTALSIPDEQIAVATGTERGIEGLNLLDPQIKIRYIITKQALKEGWDCPFAYVFCSVAPVSSSKDAEQLLGRVLRMPNIQRKQNDELNYAYAFVSSDNFYSTAKNLQDSLVQVGFSKGELLNFIKTSPQQPSFNNFFGYHNIGLSKPLDISKLSTALQNKVEFNSDDNSLVFKNVFNETEKEEIKSLLEDKQSQQVLEDVYESLQRFHGTKKAPSQSGEVFSIPQLLINFDNENRIFDEEVLLPREWNLAKCDAKLSNTEFPPKIDAGTKGLLDIDNRGEIKTYSASVIQEELTSLIVSSTMDRTEIIRWLVKECRHPSIMFSQTVVFVSSVIDDLIDNRGLHTEHLVFTRHKLRDTIKSKIIGHYKAGKKKGFQDYLFTSSDRVKEDSGIFSVGKDFTFPLYYPASKLYEGPFHFSKHFYPDIAEMNGEEAECAFNIDIHPEVAVWIRNLDRLENSAFWLQTSTDKFYPDFIVKLKNGIYVIVEYKEADRYTGDDSKEKRLIGDFYAGVSAGKCRFTMLKGKDWITLKNFLNTTCKY